MGVVRQTTEKSYADSSSNHGVKNSGGDNNGSFRKNAATYFITAVAILICIIQFIDNSSLKSHLDAFNDKFNEIIGSEHVEEKLFCSGHGVTVVNGKCLCDLGYAGPTCSEAVSNELADPLPNSVLIVAEKFGSLNPKKEFESESSYLLAKNLKESGYAVYVLYTGSEEAPMFSRYQSELQANGISISRLYDNPSGLSYGANHPVEERSYEVYQYILRSPDQYSVVHFSATSGSGFYTLMAQKQGLICSKTKFVVGIDSLTPSEIEVIERNDPEYVVTEINTLKLDYVQRKSAEMANTLVVSSKFLLDSLRERGWNLSTSGIHVIDKISSNSVQGPGGKTSSVKELVFVGSLSAIDGIKVFCEAIDLIAAELGQADISVSFVGIPKTIEELPSDEWIEVHASSWDEHSIKWNIVPVTETTGIVKYLAGAAGRIAVLPTLFDPSAIVAQEILYGGFPFVASSKSAIKDMIVSEDTSRVLVNPDVADLTKKFRDMIGGQVLIARPVGSKFASVESWLELHTQLVLDDTAVCTDILDEVEELPLVSIVLVHHNRGALLKQAVASIEAQTYPNIEVILVDDGSTDKASIKIMESVTWGWWENKGWKVIRGKNRYLGAARNTGVKHSSGKYVMFMDDDDLSKPHQVETYVRVAMKTGAQIVTSGHDVFSGMHSPVAARSQDRYLPLGPAVLVGVLENIYGDSKMFVDRETFINVGGFTEDYGVGFEDYEFLAKMALSNKKLEAVSEPLNWYRRHADAMSYNTNLKTNQLRMLRAYVDESVQSSPHLEALLQFAQETFFDRHGVRAFQVDAFPTNTTRPVPTQLQTSAAPEPTEIIDTDRCPGLEDCRGRCPGEKGYPWSIDCASQKCIPFDRLTLVDLCGVCGGSNSICEKVAGAEPEVVPNKIGASFSLYGAGFNSITTIVFINGVLVKNSDLTFSGTQYIKVTMANYSIPAVPADKSFAYATVKVQFDNDTIATTEVIFYDSSDALITDISPKQIDANTYDDVFLTGNFIEFADAVCVYTVDGETSSLYTKAYYVNATMYTCVAPAMDVGEFVNVDILYSRPQYPSLEYPEIEDMYRPDFFIPTSKTIGVKVYALAPVITKALFDNSGSSILVQFDRDVALVDSIDEDTDEITTIDISSTLPTCSFVFSQKENGLLYRSGSDTDCIITLSSPNVLKLNFSTDFTFDSTVSPIIPGQSITLLSSKIVHSSSTYSHRSSGKATVGLPKNAPVPAIIAKAPSMISGCSAYTLDLSSCTGSAGREWKSVSITVTSDAGSESETAVIEELNAFEAAFKLGTSTSLSLEGLVKNSTYSFEVSLQNFFGKKSTKTAEVFVSDQNDVPVVSVIYSADEAWNPKDVNYLNAVAAPSCENPKDTIVFNWEPVNSAAKAIDDIESWTGSNSGPVLVFHPYELKPLTVYSFSLKAGIDTGDDAVNMYSMGVFNFTTDQNIYVSAGSSRIMGSGNSLRMSATIVDDAYASIVSSRYQCSWSCLTSPDMSSCLVNGAIFNQHSCSFTLSANSLEEGEYSMWVSVRNKVSGSSWVSSEIVTISVVSHLAIPIVSVVPSDVFVNSQDSNFNLEAFASSFKSSSSLVYSWSSEAACNGETYITADISEANLLPETSSVFKFKANTLPPSSSYCIQVSVTNKQNEGPAIANIIVNTRGVPRGGVCESIGSTVGNAWSDNFEMYCHGWSTDVDSSPLFYEFAINNASATSNEWSILQSLSTDASFNGVLPPGKWNMRVRIVDDANGFTYTPEILYTSLTIKTTDTTARKKLVDKDSILEFLKVAEAEYLATQNYVKALQAIATVAAYLPENITDEDWQTIDQFMVEFLQKIHDSGDWVLDYYKQAPFAAGLLANLVGQSFVLPGNTGIDIFELGAGFLSQVIDLSYPGCFSPSVASQFLHGLDGAISSASFHSTKSVVFGQKLNSLLKSVNACLLDKMVCGEEAYSHVGSSFISETGIVDAANLNSIHNSSTCPFKFSDFNSKAGCIVYECGQEYSATYFPQKLIDKDPRNVAFADVIVFVDLQKESDGSEFDTSILGTISISEDLAAALNLKNYNLSDTSAYFQPMVQQFVFDGDNENIVTASLTKETATLVSVDGVDFDFTSDETGYFGIMVVAPSKTQAGCAGLEDCRGLCPGSAGYGVYKKDCSGECKLPSIVENWYVIDCSGNCLPPAMASSYDQCGVCGGFNTTCLDCNGIANGTDVYDRCGVCGGDGTKVPCFGMFAIEPSVVKNEPGTKFVIAGAGFGLDETPAYGENPFTTIYVNEVELTKDIATLDLKEVDDVTYVIVSLKEKLDFLVDSAEEVVILAKNSYGDATFNFHLYNPESEPEISVITPRYVYSDKAGYFKLENEDASMIQFPFTRCVVQDENDKLLYTYYAQFKPQTDSLLAHYVCTTPALQMTGNFSLNLMYSSPTINTPLYPDVEDYNRPDWFVSGPQYGQYLKAVAPAPDLVSTNALGNNFYSRFDDNGASVTAVFDKDIVILQSSLSDYSPAADIVDFNSIVYCNQAFITNGTGYGLLARDESPSDCILTQPSSNTLTLTFAGEFASQYPAIVPGQRLAVLPGVIATAGVIYSDTANGSVIVGYPKNVPVPSIIAVAPNVISNCPDFTIDLSQVSGSAGRAWNVSMNVTSVNYTASEYSSIQKDELTKNLNAELMNSDTIEGLNDGSLYYVSLTNDTMPPGSYEFAITFQNFLGGTATAYVRAVRTAGNNVPLVVLSSENGISNLNVEKTNILVAGAEALDGKCKDTRSIVFKWYSDDLEMTTDDSSTKSSYAIMPYSMTPNTPYKIYANASYVDANGNPVKYYTFSIEISTQLDIIYASAGSSKTLGSTNSIVMDATIIDSAYETLNLDNFACSWECRALDEKGEDYTSLCVNASSSYESSSEVSYLSLTDITSCSLDLTKQLLEGTYKISISVENLISGSVTRDENVSPAYLEIVSGQLPVVNIFATELNPGSFSSRFYLDAVVDPETVKDISKVSYTWSAPSICFGNAYSSLNLSDKAGNTVTGRSSKILKFNPGSLKPRAVYCIAIEVTDETQPSGSKPGQANVIITVRDVPSSGVCSFIGAPGGQPFQDEIIFKCSGWVTDPASYPLSYSFLFANWTTYEQDGSTALVSPSSPSSVASSVFSKGYYLIYAVVTDSSGSYAGSVDFTASNFTIDESFKNKKKTKKKIDSSRPSMLVKRSYGECNIATAGTQTAAALKFLEGSISTFAQTQKASDAVSACQIAAQALPANVMSSADKCAQPLHDTIIEFLSSIVTSGNWYLDTQTAAPFAAGVLQSTVGSDWALGSKQTKNAFDITTMISNQIVQNAGSTNCYNAATARKFITTFDAIVSSLTLFGYNSNIASSWNAALQTLSNCQYNNLVCGQTPFGYNGKNLTLASGIQDSSTVSQYCSASWQVKDFASTSSPQTSGCIKFTCNSLQSSGLIADTNMYTTVPNATAMSNTTSHLRFFKRDSTSVSIVNGQVSGKITLDPNFVATQLKDGFAPQVVKIVLDDTGSYSTAKLNTSGVTTSSWSGGNTVSFSSDSSGSYWS